MAKAELKKLLLSMDRTELISLILDLYSAKKEITEYLDYFVNPDEADQFLKAKRTIENEYFPLRGCPKERLSVAKKAISDFSKLKPTQEQVAELMIFLVECGCKYTNEYGDMNDSFYTGMENNFNRALKFMKKHNLLKQFKANAERCVELSSPCGYGFADTIEIIFDEYYSDLQ